MYTNVAPIVAMITAFVALHEPIGTRKLVGAAAVLAGVAMNAFLPSSFQLPAASFQRRSARVLQLSELVKKSVADSSQPSCHSSLRCAAVTREPDAGTWKPASEAPHVYFTRDAVEAPLSRTG